MARFRTYGQLDSPHATDGSMAFVRMISRLNPEQLAPGDVPYSQNGRMDNDRTWTPRLGVDVFSPALTLDTNVLRFDDNGTPPAFDDAGTPPAFTDGVVNAVYGSAVYTDPTTGQDYLIIATNTKAIAIDMSDTDTTFDIAYPAGETIKSSVEMLSALDALILFRDGQTAWRFTGYLYSPFDILGAARATDVVTVTTDGAHGLGIGDYTLVADLGFTGDDPNGTVVVTDVPTTTTFTYDSTGADETFSIVDPTISLSMGNVATTATVVTVDGSTSNAVVADGTVTITKTAHGRNTGDILRIYDGGESGLVEGDRYEITKVDANSYTFQAEIADGTFTVYLGGKQPLGGGYIAMPDPPWGVSVENRLVVPYQRSLSTGVSRDEVVFSDILDFDTFDPVLNQFRMGGGKSDPVIGVSPLLDDRLLVFCRRSVHVIGGVSGSLQDATRTEITREIGCVARNTIQEIGGTVVWLSDQGVYTVSYGQELNLMANSIPLSEPIENQIRQINWAHASNAVAAYNDNRYYLAVPYNGSSDNNVVFVYNFLNQGWESVDTYPEGFNITNIIVTPYEGKNTVFLVNEDGAVHRADVHGGVDKYQNDASRTQTQTIDGQVLTKLHTFGTTDNKRFNRASVLAEGDVGTGTLKVSALTRDPEAEKVIDEQLISARDDYNLKGRIAKRGYGAQLKMETSSAKIRGYTVDAIVNNMSNSDKS